METCKNCGGDGRVGAGPNPHLLEGTISICPECNGTGKVSVAGQESAPVDEQVATDTQTTDVEEKKDETESGAVASEGIV